MERSRSNANPLHITLGPGGYVLALDPEFVNIFGIAKITLSTLYAEIQPKNNFLSLCNSEGSGVFSIHGQLYEIESHKNAHNQSETILSFTHITDDSSSPENERHILQEQNSQQAFLKPFEIVKLFALVFKQIKDAQTCSFYLQEPQSKLLFPQLAQGFRDDDRIRKVVMTENAIIAKALKTHQPLRQTRLNFFQDYPLDQTSIMEYRYATGGQIPRSALVLPLALEGYLPSFLLIENYDQPDAFPAVDLPALVEEIKHLIIAKEKYAPSEQNELETSLQSIDSIYTFLDDLDPTEDLSRSIQPLLSFLLKYDSMSVWQATSVSNEAVKLTNYKSDRVSTMLTPEELEVIQRRPISTDQRETPINYAQLLSTSSQSAIIFAITKNETPWGVITVESENKHQYTPSHLNALALVQKFISKKMGSGQPSIPQPASESHEITIQNQKRLSQNIAVWEAVIDGVLVTDSINRIQFTNTAFNKLINLPKGKLAEPTIESINELFKTTLFGWKDRILTWSIDPDSIDTGENYTEQVKMPNGRILSIHLSPVMWGKEFLGTVSILRDVSYEFEFDRLKTDFITSISHELRTPLTSIQGYIDLLLMGVAGNISDEQRSFMSIVKNNSARLNNLINDMLELTTLEAGKANITIHPTDIFTLAKDVIARFKELSEKENKTIEFFLETDPNIPMVMADPERARQILENLVSNAYSITETDGKIVISLKHSDNDLRVDIKDTGIGIPSEQRDQIFDHFIWGDHPNSHNLQNIGLGLPIVKQLIELQNGRIWVESSGIPGEGSTFSFTLPAQTQ